MALVGREPVFCFFSFGMWGLRWSTQDLVL